MFLVRFYPLIFLLQGYCLYHAYKNGSQQKWYWIIVFLPFIGSMIYLYENFYNRRNVAQIQETVKTTFVANYQVDKLKGQLKYSDTESNRVALAEEYINQRDYDRAIETLNPLPNKGSHIIMMLMFCSYHQAEYNQVIKYAKLIEDKKEFKNTQEMAALAWSYHHTGQPDLAKQTFDQLDRSFCNYNFRLDYVQYLNETGDNTAARALSDTLLDELGSMDSYELSMKKGIYKQIKAYSKIL